MIKHRLLAVLLAVVLVLASLTGISAAAEDIIGKYLL